jgi:integrase
MARYRGSVKAFITWLDSAAALPLDSLTSSRIRAFRDALHSEGRTAKTVNHYMADLKAALIAAEREGIINRMPWGNLDPLPEEDSTEREPFTIEEVSRLSRSAPTEDWRGVILLGAYGGLRLGDAASMKRGSVDLKAKVIRYLPQKTGRKAKKKEVELPMHSELIRFFSALDLPADPAAPAFPTLAKVSIAGNRGLSTRFIGIMKLAKIDRGQTRKHVDGKAGRSAHARSFHSLRHTFNSSLMNKGVTQESRMLLIGHMDEQVNAGYSHADIEHLRKQIDLIPALKMKGGNR